MDVHPPHGAIHSWRDFFVHLAIITLGLLIALSLEGIVGWVHDRQLVHTAEANLKTEIQSNRALLAKDLPLLDAAQKQVESDVVALSTYKPGITSPTPVRFYWEWDGPNAAAWDTARNTGAIALMDYQTAQEYAGTYAQQALVSDQATIYIRDLVRSAAPLEGGRKLNELKPAEIDEMIVNLRETMADLKYLQDLCATLSHHYESAQQ